MAWYCTQCTREVAETVMGLAGPLGYCTHSDTGVEKDGSIRPSRLVPVVADQDKALELREAKLDRQALRRALVKANTAEGRESLTTREARQLAKREDA